MKISLLSLLLCSAPLLAARYPGDYDAPAPWISLLMVSVCVKRPIQRRLEIQGFLVKTFVLRLETSNFALYSLNGIFLPKIPWPIPQHIVLRGPETTRSGRHREWW